MAQVIKFTYPTGKVFISRCDEDGVDDYGPFDWESLRQDLSKLPALQQSDYTIRRQVLWEKETCSPQLLAEKWKKAVLHYRANEIHLGYNSLSYQSEKSLRDSHWRLGVDGCRAGWFYVGCNGSEYRYGIVAKISQLFEQFDHIVEIIIDIPIGLYDSGAKVRQCDVMARKALKPRGSTVFPAPVRPCLYEESYSKACDVSERLTGKKLSQQAYNIFAKIREVDELLQRQPELKNILNEAHPELGFCMLNGGSPLLTRKKEQNGIEERLILLKQSISQSTEIYKNALMKFSRKDLAKNDIVDALMCLCISNAGAVRRKTLPTVPEKDENGIEMVMHYAIAKTDE